MCLTFFFFLGGIFLNKSELKSRSPDIRSEWEGGWEKGRQLWEIMPTEWEGYRDVKNEKTKADKEIERSLHSLLNHLTLRPLFRTFCPFFLFLLHFLLPQQLHNYKLLFIFHFILFFSHPSPHPHWPKHEVILLQLWWLFLLKPACLPALLPVVAWGLGYSQRGRGTQQDGNLSHEVREESIYISSCVAIWCGDETSCVDYRYLQLVCVCVSVDWSEYISYGLCLRFYLYCFFCLFLFYLQKLAFYYLIFSELL